MISKELVFYKLENDSNVSISNKDIIIKENLDNTRLKMQILAKLEDELKKIDTNYIGCEILSKIYKNL